MSIEMECEDCGETQEVEPTDNIEFYCRECNGRMKTVEEYSSQGSSLAFNVPQEQLENMTNEEKEKIKEAIWVEDDISV